MNKRSPLKSIAIVGYFLFASVVNAEPVSVRHVQGFLRGFLVLKDTSGQILASVADWMPGQRRRGGRTLKAINVGGHAETELSPRGGGAGRPHCTSRYSGCEAAFNVTDREHTGKRRVE
jgi:hypothetical protein